MSCFGDDLEALNSSRRELRPSRRWLRHILFFVVSIFLVIAGITVLGQSASTKFESFSCCLSCGYPPSHGCTQLEVSMAYRSEKEPRKFAVGGGTDERGWQKPPITCELPTASHYPADHPCVAAERFYLEHPKK